MPAPVIGPCGGPNQPACPPTPASSTNDGPLYLVPAKEIVRAFHGLSIADKAQAYADLAAEQQ